MGSGKWRPLPSPLFGIVLVIIDGPILAEGWGWSGNPPETKGQDLPPGGILVAVDANWKRKEFGISFYFPDFP